MQFMESPSLAVVTGAGTGMGRAISRHLSAVGVEVILVGRRAGMLAETASHCASPTCSVAGDVADSDCHQRICDAIAGRPLHYRVQLAGMQTLAPIESLTRQDWEASFATLVHARLYLVQTLLPRFAPAARILLAGSRSSVTCRQGAAAYCCSYAATRMLVECLRAELSPRLQIISFLPGSVDTPLLQESMKVPREIFPDGRLYEEERQRGELISPETVARFVSWLLLVAPTPVYAEMQVAIDDDRYLAAWQAAP